MVKPAASPLPATAGEPPGRSRLVRDAFDALALALVGAHAVYWTVMPSLVSGTFTLDAGEALFWGREWQLGYYKHPPLMAWVAELGVAAFGRSLATIYLVSQGCIAAAFAGVWWLARRLVSSAGAFLAVAALMLFLPFTVQSVNFNANVALLPFWAWAIGLAWTALEKNTVGSWLGLGAVAGLGLLAKYSILILAAAIALYCLLTPARRWVLRAPGPWIALAAALLVASPHLFWLATQSAGPLANVVEARAAGGMPPTPLFHAALFLAHQVVVALPLLAVVAVWAVASGRGFRAVRAPAPESHRHREALRYLLFATLAPVALTLAAALASGQNAPTRWSFTFPIAAGLLAVLAWPWLERDLSERRAPGVAISTFAAGALALAAAWPIHHRGAALLGRAPPKTAYDGAAEGAIVDAFWERRRAGPLRYQVSHFGGPEGRALASGTAFFSRHRPSVFHGADRRLAPWIDLADYRRHGGVVVAEGPIRPGTILAGLCVTEVERFERPIRYRGYGPAHFHVGLLAPSPEPKRSCP